MEIRGKTSRPEEQEAPSNPLTAGAELLEGSGFENEVPEPDANEDDADA